MSTSSSAQQERIEPAAASGGREPMGPEPRGLASAEPRVGTHASAVVQHRYPSWRALSGLFLLRLLLVLGLVVVFAPLSDDPLVPGADPGVVWRVLLGYALAVLSSGLCLYGRWPSLENQVYLAVFADILALTLLMHAGGGVSSGLGMLIAVAVAAGALMMEGRMALLFAAMAALAVMAEQGFVHLHGDPRAAQYTQAGLLGLLFFAVALLAHGLYKRLHDIEALAARRKVDIDDLSKLNEYIIQNLSTGVMVVDGERRLRLLNQAARELVSAPEAGAGEGLVRIAPGLAEWLSENCRPEDSGEGLVQIGEREIRARRQLLGDYRAAGMLIFLRDNRELLKEAQQMKLASLGTLTASIAHNIRNPLGAVSHAAQLLGEAQGLVADDRYLLDIVRRNCARIDEIVDSVLQLSRRHQMDARVLDLATWVPELCLELRECHGLDADRLRLEIEPESAEVEVDPRHLRQILSNLCDNAIVHGGRAVRIDARLYRHAAGAAAVMELCDDGPGIDEAVQREMFSPFYTTRSTGTGLGLYIARELAQINGIDLTYERREPRGSCFRLHFTARD